MKSVPKKEQKGSKGKADSHRTAQPKAYGIMAEQKGGFAELSCYPATLRDLFRFLLVFLLVRLVKMAFFFFCFFVLETIFERGQD
ncbi:hypothetical protein [Sphingobacterium siyangense]|uniref:hypothetical protein n=1 Tax=Sphingobacterium siyangense TaxID=459529 RepID=UPI002FDEFF0D